MAKQVAQQDKADVSVIEGFTDYLNRRADQDAEGEFDGQSFTASQLERILNAPSTEAMWDADDADSSSGKELEDVEQRIISFRVMRSDKYDSGIPAGGGFFFFYWVTALNLESGVTFTWNTGAPLIMGKLRYLEAAELLNTPEADCVIRGRDTDAGFRVLKLRPLSKRAATVVGAVS